MTESKSHVSDPAGFKAVVDAEKTAADRLESGGVEVETIRQDATARERRIAHRADRRLQALHAAMQGKIAEDKARMLEAFETERRDLSAVPGPSEIEAAALRLARQLVGFEAE